MAVPGGLYVLLLMFLLFSFPALCSAVSQRCLGRLPRNSETWLEMCALRQCRSQNMGEHPPKHSGRNCFSYI